MLFSYMQKTSRLIHDAKNELVDPYDIIDYINTARREVAMRAQCVRLLTPISGSITGVSIVNPGIAYTSPTVSITAPDFPSGTTINPNGLQATAVATESAGTIASVSITNPGAGYFQPQAIIVDATGSLATLSLTLSAFNTIGEGQEVYPFSQVALPAGYGSVYLVRSVSIIYANYRYSLPIYSFSTYQAYIRQYPFQYQYVPTIGSQFGQGTNGSFYLYPIPSETYQLEWDCSCLPADLQLDTDPEAIPAPWTDAVPYFAAHLAMLELQNGNSARMYLDLFDKRLSGYSAYARPGRAVNPYGRY